MKRKLFVALVSVFTLFTTLLNVNAAASIKEVDYDGKGEVEVEFAENVTYNNPKVTVKDASGKTYSATIIEKDNDSLEFKVNNLSSGTNYSFTISGVKFRSGNSFTSVSGSFKTPVKKQNNPTTPKPTTNTLLKVKEVEYDFKDKELEIEFNTKVQYKNPKVLVKDNSGKTFEAKIYNKGDDDLEAIVFGLEKGKTYSATITGVAKRGTATYTTITTNFRVGNGVVASIGNTKLDGFVSRAYRLCLGRNPEKSGLNYWTKRLNNRQETAASTVQGFFESKELSQMRLSNADYVEKCYNVMMNRSSDKGGKAYWMNKLANGMSKKELLRNFVNSNEFAKIVKEYNINKGNIR